MRFVIACFADLGPRQCSSGMGAFAIVSALQEQTITKQLIVFRTWSGSNSVVAAQQWHLNKCKCRLQFLASPFPCAVDKLCADHPGVEGDAEGVRRDARRVYGGALRVRTIS